MKIKRSNSTPYTTSKQSQYENYQQNKKPRVKRANNPKRSWKSDL